jgi:hypothetical protein
VSSLKTGTVALYEFDLFLTGVLKEVYGDKFEPEN